MILPSRVMDNNNHLSSGKNRVTFRTHATKENPLKGHISLCNKLKERHSTIRKYHTRKRTPRFQTTKYTQGTVLPLLRHHSAGTPYAWQIAHDGTFLQQTPTTARQHRFRGHRLSAHALTVVNKARENDLYPSPSQEGGGRGGGGAGRAAHSWGI